MILKINNSDNSNIELDWIRLISRETISYVSINKTIWDDFTHNPDNSGIRWLQFTPQNKNQSNYFIKPNSIIGFKLKD